MPVNESTTFEQQTSKGRRIKVTLHRWNDLLLRSKNGCNMKDKPFDVVCAYHQDVETGEFIFTNPLFIAVNGVNKSQITTKKAYKYYRHRYDIEPTNRFEKQHLLLDKYQSCDVQHIDNWLLVVMLAMWLLFTASKQAPLRVEKWEQYLPSTKKATEAKKLAPESTRLSMTQTKKGVKALYFNFNLTPFAPKKSKGGKGRLLGQMQTPRTRYKVVRKQAKMCKKQPAKNKNGP